MLNFTTAAHISYVNGRNQYFEKNIFQLKAEI